MDKSTAVVVLAAGKGSRMLSKGSKVLKTIGGKTCISRILETIESFSNDADTYVVCGYDSESVIREISKYDVVPVKQEKQEGTGHALKIAMESFNKNYTKVVVLSGDVPLISKETLDKLINAEKNNFVIATVFLDNPTGYGRIVFDNQGKVKKIVEDKDASAEQKKINTINAGIYSIPLDWLKKSIKTLNHNNNQNEFYLTDLVERAYESQIPIQSIYPLFPFEFKGVNNQLELASLERLWQKRQAQNYSMQGIQFADMDRIDIRGKLIFGLDCFVDVNVIFEGNCILGDNVTIGAGSILKNSTIGSNVEVKPYSLIEDSFVDDNCCVGPFARLRPGTKLGTNSKIGNFVETKNSKIANNSKVNHLSYVGDSEVGEGVNIGAGTITCNYDGKNKHKTIIGNKVKIGAGNMLVAPLKIADGVTSGAGTTILKDVMEKCLVVNKKEQKCYVLQDKEES